MTVAVSAINDRSYWVGIDTPGASELDLRYFNSFYSSIHVPEVLENNPGFIKCERYELVKPDERGDFGPRWLARYTMDETAAQRYLEDNASPGYVTPYTDFPKLGCAIVVRWRLLWAGLVAEGRASGRSERIRLIGMDPAPGSTEDEVHAFNRFYDDIHLVEARLILSAGYASRYELTRNLLPGTGSPRYAALYELVLSQKPSDLAYMKPSSGPPPWEDRVVHWRLDYARLP